MFLITWVFDKLGYMPKIDVQVGRVDLDIKDTWPFPAETPKVKPTVKKATARKPRATKKPVVAKTARAKKTK
jgi:hypothetical protein